MIRIGADYLPLWTTIACYVAMFISWVHFRLVAFLQTVLSYPLKERCAIDNHTSVVTVISILLTLLLAMNIYWFVLMVKVGWDLIYKKRKVDHQNKLTYKDTKHTS